MRVEDVNGEIGVREMQLVDELFVLRGVDRVPERAGSGGDGVDIGLSGLTGRQLVQRDGAGELREV